MTVLLMLAGTALAMVLLVLYSHYLFEENRTRVVRARRPVRPNAPVEPEQGAVQWRTLVDPIEAATRARASQPFAAAYARAMSSAATSAHDDRAA